MKPIRRIFLASFTALVLAACAPKTETPASAPLKVFAAASLTDVLPPIAEAFAAETGAPTPVLVFASSAELARQIEQGAEADIFISADEAWMDYLAERDLIDPATRQTLLTNRLVMVAPADRPLVIDLVQGADVAGALAGGRLAMGDPDSVPAGRYAREAFEALGVWASVEPLIVRSQSVRDALRFVESGDAAAGVVYAADAAAAGNRVALVATFDPATHTPITYPAASVVGKTAASAPLLAYLHSASARERFANAGFGAS